VSPTAPPRARPRAATAGSGGATRVRLAAAPAPRGARDPRDPRGPRGPRRPPPRRTRHRGGDPRRRLIALAVVCALLFSAVVARVAVLQGPESERYRALGESQRMRSVSLPAERGAVYDRNGFELAMSVPQTTIWADPSAISDPVRVAGLLAPVLGADPAVLTQRLSREGSFAYLARQVDDVTAERVRALDLPGVYDMPEAKRFLPSGDLARGVLGAVNADGVGSAGLEQVWDEVLSGEPGTLERERDRAGRTIPSGRQRLEPPVPGDDLVLTIDRSMQYAAERALADAILATEAKGATAVVMDSRTGDIYAMANMVADEEGGPPRSSRANSALVNVFEPGSVNKIITIAGALEEDVVDPGTVFEVPDHIQVADASFRDSSGHPTQRWTVTDIMAESSNVGTIMIGREAGREKIDEYLRRFGFGEVTALRFPNESAGILLDPEDWNGTSIASLSIGYGLAVTAMQMLAAVNVIAAGGEYVEPRLVSATIDGDGERQPLAPAPRRRVVSETTANQVRSMLQEVVARGTAKSAAIDGYSVAGKTGTARKALPEGGYSSDSYVSSFAGFVPAEDPRLSIIVSIDEPQTQYYAAQVAAPVFAELARFALRQYRIPPPVLPDGVAPPQGSSTSLASLVADER